MGAIIMLVKIVNKTTNEVEIKEVVEYTSNSITEQAGRGIMVTNYDDNYEISEYVEDEQVD